MSCSLSTASQVPLTTPLADIPNDRSQAGSGLPQKASSRVRPVADLADGVHRRRMVEFTGSLVIGGTGMLAAATRWLADRSAMTLLVARRASAFVGARDVVPIDADWRSAAFADAVEEAIDLSASMDAALLWLHEPGPILPWLLPKLGSARVVLLLGSMDGRPRVPEGAAHLTTVRLGSVRTHRGRRWLTDAEISAAAIAALSDGESRTVGDLAAPC